MSEFRRRLLIQSGGAGGKYIKFKDPVVEQICISKWSSDGIGLTPEDAAKVTDIGTTFKGNTEITSFDEFENFIRVEKLPRQAFYGCSLLSSITLPNVSLIEYAAFVQCVNLASINIPSSLTGIGEYAFNNCSSLTTLIVEDYEKLFHIEITTSSSPFFAIDVVNTSTHIYTNGMLLTEISIPSSASVIPNMLFQGNRDISSIDISTGIEKIGKASFCYCTNITSDIIIPNSVKEIGEDAFRGCSLSGELILSEGLQSVGRRAFSLCGKKKKVSIPSTLSEIVFGMFAGTEIESLICKRTTPPTLSSYSFDNVLAIYVLDESLEAYKTAWSSYASRIKPLSEYQEQN